MLSTIEFIEVMIPLYLMILIGYIGRKRQILSEHTNEVLTQLLLSITLPSLIVYSLNTNLSLHLLSDLLWLISMSIFQMSLSIFIAHRASKYANLTSDKTAVYKSLIIFGNQGFMGVAISFILAGPQGIIYVTFFNLVYIIMIWTYGLSLFRKGKGWSQWKYLLLNPGIIASSIGLIILFSPIQLPSSFVNLLESVGKMTIPLSMILIGSMLANLSFKTMLHLIKNRYVWYANFIKLIIIPCLLLFFKFVKVPFLLLTVAVLTAAMPSASTTTVYAQKFHADTSFSSFSVFISNFLCLITIPLIYSVLLWINILFDK